MKFFIGILIGISLMFAFQKITKEKDQMPTAETVNTPLQKTEKETIPPDFLIFYSQFHNDSLFQIEHIDFPLSGIPNYADSLILAENNFRWEKDNWEIHKLTDLRKDNFHEDLVIMDEGFIKEFISVGQGEKQLWMERRFLKSSGDWRLIYFAGLNKRD